MDETTTGIRDDGAPPATSAGRAAQVGSGARDLGTAGGRSRGRWIAFDWRANGQTIPERVQALAARHPDRLAAFDTEAELTYEALDRAANRVANTLLTASGPSASAILLLFDVGVHAIAAALGVLKAGKHFVGVEPSFPPSRIEEIADDAAATAILTDAGHLPFAREIARNSRAVIAIDALADADDHAPCLALGFDTIALLNYTSGSTGKPKGVVQTHRSTIAQACRYGNAFRLGNADRLASFGSLAWAGAIWDAFGSLCLGAAVGAFDVRRHGVHALPAWLDGTGTTVLSGMTVARRLAFDFPQLRVPRVRLIQLGGDTVYRRDVEACQRVFPNAILAVGLGTTEAGRIAEQFIAPGTRVEQEVVPVGFATHGVRIALVAEDGIEVAPGEVGEIVAESDELAAGYRNLPVVTADRFRPGVRHDGARRYFTGDLGRLLPDGTLQHAGRKDFQIKIHGYPVSANEVEALLLETEGVREACVVAQQSATGVEQLVAFLARDTATPLSIAALRARLSAALPDYMVPRRFVGLDALPRTPTGKVDRKALPAAPTAHRDLETAPAEPRSALETKLVALWSDVLGIDTVGIDDDFLALGGDSLGAVQIANRVVRDFGVEVPLAALLAKPTVAAMAALIESDGAGAAPRPRMPAIRPRNR